MTTEWPEEVLKIIETEIFKYYNIFGHKDQLKGNIQKLISENQNEIKQFKHLNAINYKNDDNLFFSWQTQVSFLITKQLAQKILIIKELEK